MNCAFPGPTTTRCCSCFYLHVVLFLLFFVATVSGELKLVTRGLLSTTAFDEGVYGRGFMSASLYFYFYLYLLKTYF